jgi:hypothetical protein
MSSSKPNQPLSASISDNHTVLNTSTTIETVTHLGPNITIQQALSMLHSNEKMLALNPIRKSHKLLPESSSVAFFKQVPAENKPPATGEYDGVIPVYEIVEAMESGTAEGEAQSGSWRGGWASRFIPDTITYESSIQNTPSGMVSITHAPMGVHSMTTWVVREATEEEGKGPVLEKTGKVTSNRMLMGFIKTTLQESYEKLDRDFVAALERDIAGQQEVEKIT